MIQKTLILILIISITIANNKIIAISYFDNTSNITDYNPLSKGLADMLITDLSNIKSINIVEREKLESLLKEIELGNSKFINKETAQKLGEGLGAGYILTGSFLILDETMRIDARLVDVSTGKIIMAEEITGEKNTFFDLEKELVNKLIATFDISLSKSESRKVKKIQTESFESFHAYSNAIDAYDEGEYEESVKLLEQATEADENFDLAWDKLDDLESQLEQLLLARQIKLSKNLISIIDNLEKNDKNSCETFLNMYDKKYSYLVYDIWNDEKYMEPFYDSKHKETISSAFNELYTIYKYIDTKEYPNSLCEEINSSRGLTNINEYIWGLSLFENLIVDILEFEINAGSKIIINDRDIKTLVDEMIILYEQKLIKLFPNRSSYDSEKSLANVKRAIHRKQNPNIYIAYAWVHELDSWALKNYFLHQRRDRDKDKEKISFSRVKDPVTSFPEELNLISGLKYISFSMMMLGGGGDYFYLDCNMMNNAKKYLTIDIYGDCK